MSKHWGAIKWVMNLKSNIIGSNYDISSNSPFIKKRPAKRGFLGRKYFAKYSL